MSASNIVVAFTGSIASYKACEVVSQLVQHGHKVRTVATASALQFVGQATLEGLTGERVRTDLFEPGTALEHIDLGRWADAILVCPATANTLNRLSAGLADDLLGALFLARDPAKPLVVAPAMNPRMWDHPATQASVARLMAWGVRFVPVGAGRMACGDVGSGRLADPDQIVAFLESTLARPVDRLRVLITSGATSEPLDDVRVLTNTSSGRTGAGLAAHFARRGHEVLLLRAPGSAASASAVREDFFGTVDELDERLGRYLGAEDWNVVIHAAAVSDFRIESVTVDGAPRSVGAGKLGSDAAPVIRLRPGPKLIDTLRARSRKPDLAIVAFKLTAGASSDQAREAVGLLFERAGVDWVVQNDLRARVDAEQFPADIFRRDGSVAAHCTTRAELAVELERLLASRRPSRSVISP